MPASGESVYIQADSLPWRRSPYTGVTWKKLRYDEGSCASTILLKFAPGGWYGAHRHPQGEEYWVLEGSLEDGDRTHGPGTYVYHPPGSVHRPYSKGGCLLLVSLPHPIEIVEVRA
jgi:anti-sigma factor ChrR (cupin superfamily)